MPTASPAELTPALRRRWFIFAILAIGYMLVYFHRLCPAVVAKEMMTSLGVGGAIMGVLASAYFYPYALMQLPAGLLADSWGPRRTITLFFIVAAVGSALLGLAPNSVVAIIGRGLVGVGVSLLFVSTMKIQAVWFRKQEFALMAGILMAVGGAGGLLAATPLAWLAGAIGWRASFVVIGAGTLFLALLIWVVVRDKPEDLGWPSIVKADPGADAPHAAIPLGAGMKMVLTEVRFWPLAVWFFFNFAVFFSVAGLWGGPYLREACGLDNIQTGNVLAMATLSMIVFSPVTGWVSNRVGRKPVMIAGSVGVILVVIWPVLFTTTLPLWSLFVLVFCLGVFGSAVVVVGFTTAKELFPVAIAGTSTGLINLFPFAGGAVMQPVLGAVLEHFGRVGSRMDLGPLAGGIQLQWQIWPLPDNFGWLRDAVPSVFHGVFADLNWLVGAYRPLAYTRMWEFLLVSGAISLLGALFLKETLPRDKRRRA
jgi:sugar phosphate permease